MTQKLNTVERAAKKLKEVEMTFQALEKTLAQKKEPEGKYKTLVEGIQKYMYSLRKEDYMQCFFDCFPVYKALTLTRYLKNEHMKGRVKELMRKIYNRFFSDTETQANTEQLNLF